MKNFNLGLLFELMFFVKNYVLYFWGCEYMEDNQHKQQTFGMERSPLDILNSYENVVVLAGAGSSIFEGIQSGKLMSELSKEVSKNIKAELKKISELGVFGKKIYDYMNDGGEESGNNTINIEDKLSVIQEFIDSMSAVADDELNDLLNSTKELVSKIKKIIMKECKLEYSNKMPHADLIKILFNKSLRNPKKDYVKIFTTNYDTLFEQAASNNNMIVIDGFDYFSPRTFNAWYYDMEINFRNSNVDPSLFRIIHIYKLHGSIDWFIEKESGKVIKCGEKIDDEKYEPLMIYPSRNKFKETFTNPFFELYTRFIAELRKKNVLLLVIGFSFGDLHIKNAVLESLRNNTSFGLMIVDIYAEKIKDQLLKDIGIENKDNFTLVEKRIHTFSGTFMSFVESLNYKSEGIWYEKKS